VSQVILVEGTEDAAVEYVTADSADCWDSFEVAQAIGYPPSRYAFSVDSMIADAVTSTAILDVEQLDW
jgi:hypothetical protein